MCRIPGVEVLGDLPRHRRERARLHRRAPAGAPAREGAVDELAHLGLIKALGHKGEVYQVTREGYDVAELLRP